jgi:hypothetical protein
LPLSALELAVAAAARCTAVPGQQLLQQARTYALAIAVVTP